MLTVSGIAAQPNMMMANMMPPHMLAQFGMPHMMGAMNPMQYMAQTAGGIPMMPPPHQMIPPRPLFPAVATSAMNQPSMSQVKPTFPAYR